MANVFGLPYRIFVSVFGFALLMLSVTCVDIWWKKRTARKAHGQSSTKTPKHAQPVS